MKRFRHVFFIFVIISLFHLAAWGKDSIALIEGWRFTPDPEQKGLEKGYQTPGYDDSAWTEIKAGLRWEDQGFPKLDGQAWYRKWIRVPAAMRADHIWLNLGGLNDSGVIYCNGQQVGAFGEENLTSMARIPMAVDLTSSIRWGEENLLAIQVFDMGNSGGLTKEPYTLTTDKSTLVAQSLLHFVPGFDGRPSVVGMRIGALGVKKGDSVQFSLQVNGKRLATKEALVTTDHEGVPVGVARFDLTAVPGDKIGVNVETKGTPEKSGTGVSFEKTYVWPQSPQWPRKYRSLRVLNNFVTELKHIDCLTKEKQACPFLNPREGWVFIQVRGTTEPIGFVDRETSIIRWRKHPETGDYEAMHYLGEGKHTLQLEKANGMRLDIRAVPELAFCYWPTGNIEGLPPRDNAFAERYIFPNTNTLMTHDNMTEKEFDSWRAEGRHWLSNSSLPGLHEDTPPTADAVYQAWEKNPCVIRPGYSGVIVDEFLDSAEPYYVAWTAGMERLYQHPQFSGQSFYAWVVETYRYKQGLDFMRRLYDRGGRFAWERYVHEESTEDVALLRLYEQFAGAEEMNTLIPGLKQRLYYCLGSFTMPLYSLNINPGVNYIPFMEKQFHVLATDPVFFSVAGISQWTAHYTDDDVLRYALRLYRHYCLEGKRTPFMDYPYALTYIKNPDFAEGLKDWQVEAAKPDSIQAITSRNLGQIQGRWASANVGDQCAVMVRSESAPNRIRQTITGLIPGTLYSIKFIAANLTDLHAKDEVGLWPALDGVDLQPTNSFRRVMPCLSTLKVEGVDPQHLAYTTYGQLMFRPKSDKAELTFSDWKDGKPAGPAGQRIGFNFVEIKPYFEEK